MVTSEHTRRASYWARRLDDGPAEPVSVPVQDAWVTEQVALRRGVVLVVGARPRH